MKIYRSRKYSSRASSTGRRVAAYAIISLVIVVVLGVWGLTLLANLSNFWDNLRGSQIPATNSAEIRVPVAPRLSALPASTNNSKVTVSGSAEGGSTVTLFRNGIDVDNQLVGNDGQFSFKNVILREGTNLLTAKAKNNAGESPESNQVQINLDTVAPKVTVNEPVDGATTSSQFVTVSGKTDPKTTITANGQQLILQPDGSFSGVVTLSQAGSNVIQIVAADDAGNQTKITRTVTYTPQ